MINAGLDIGNGYVKGLVKNPDIDDKAQPVDIPSATAMITSSADVRISDPTAISEEMSDIYNKMEVSIESPLVEDSGARIYIGRRAVRFGKSIQEFNLREVRRSKTETELSATLVLSIIAGKTLSDYYRRTGKIPEAGETLSAEAKIALSMPISEYKVNKYLVPRSYTDSSHTVRIYNFDNVVRVDISFKQVDVAPEGAAAQFAIASKGDKFMSALVNSMIDSGLSLPDGITASDIASAQNIIGIDIGEGTVNFPIYEDYKFNPDISTTLPKGYGTVMDESVERLRQKGRPFDSRKKFTEWILDVEHRPMKRQQYQEAMGVVNAEKGIFTDELAKYFSAVLERNGAFAEVVYVYGGGATPLKDVLYPKLIKAVKRAYEDSFMPILYLDSVYSRYLNRDGLYLLASSGDSKSTEDLSKTS